MRVLTPAAVEAVVGTGLASQIEPCFIEAVEAGEIDLLEDSKVWMEFQVLADGTVTDVHARSPHFVGTRLEGCLADLIDDVKFEPVGETKTVAYPFMAWKARWKAMREARENPVEMPPDEIDLGLEDVQRAANQEKN